MKNVLFIVLLVIALLVSGCNEAKRPVYGQGNPPAEWQVMFGNSNGARLDFIQNQAIVELRDKTIKDMEVRIKALEALVLPEVKKELISRFNEREISPMPDKPTDPTRKYTEVTK